VHVHCDGLVNDVIPANDPGKVYVASAFSPNFDGMNDLFRPYASNIQSISVKVYDEQSNIVYQSTQLNAAWTLTPQFTQFQKYYYRVEAITINNHRIGICGELYALKCYPSGMNKSSFTFEDQITANGFTAVSNENLANCN
jgi:hypothetical protein